LQSRIVSTPYMKKTFFTLPQVIGTKAKKNTDVTNQSITNEIWQVLEILGNFACAMCVPVAPYVVD
jgi:hypothetical protein